MSTLVSNISNKFESGVQASAPVRVITSTIRELATGVTKNSTRTVSKPESLSMETAAKSKLDPIVRRFCQNPTVLNLDTLVEVAVRDCATRASLCWDCATLLLENLNRCHHCINVSSVNEVKASECAVSTVLKMRSVQDKARWEAENGK